LPCLFRPSNLFPTEALQGVLLASNDEPKPQIPGDAIMSFASGFYTTRDAFMLTRQPLAKQVFASSWNVHQLAQFMHFNPIVDGSASVDYRRRAHGDLVQIQYITPGAAVTPTKDPHIVELKARLRTAVRQPQVPSHVRQNYNNAPFMGGSPWRNTPDPLWAKTYQVISDLARQAWTTAISGRHIDTCSLSPSGAILATFISGVIDPGPYNDPIRGTGMLEFIFGTKKVHYKAPGDVDYGPEIGPINPGDIVTLRSGNMDAWITFTVGVLPLSDAASELLFSSTSNQPDGLITLIEKEQIITLPTFTAIDFKHLRQLLNKLNPAYRDSESTVFIMHPEQFAALESLARGLGGATLQIRQFGMQTADVAPTLKGMGMITLPTWEGHAILQDDTIPIKVIGGKPTRAVFCVNLDPQVLEGEDIDFGAFVGIVRGDPFGPVWQGFGFGWEVVELGRDQQSTNDLARVTLDHGWALGSSGAASMMEGLFDPGF
jgi:hypothetical protein